jgi:hypothetical protein
MIDEECDQNEIDTVDSRIAKLRQFAIRPMADKLNLCCCSSLDGAALAQPPDMQQLLSRQFPIKGRH